jgi:cytochrome d ubiquinol oxidase subunit II
MQLHDVPIALLLLGLVMYGVLGGADFGAGLWQLLAPGGARGRRMRDHAHRSLAPVWEANHVWLIFVLVVAWTAYPVAFGSIASTLTIPLFAGAVGIIMLGAAYALREGASSVREVRRIDTVFSASSVLTPFAFGAAVGAIASRRVPVGNAAGDLVTSWLNATSLLTGALAVTTGGYLAAVYLAADATRLGERDLAQAFRARALVAGVVAGALALSGPVVLHADARPLYDGLVEGNGLPALIASIAAGIASLALVWRRSFEPARYAASVAVAAIIAGWALAQAPILLPGLTVEEAAAPEATLVALLVVIAVGALILGPSLGFLFRLVLTGRFDRPPTPAPTPEPRDVVRPLGASARGLARPAAVLAVAGFCLLTIAEAGWAHAVGVAALVGATALGFLAVVAVYLDSELEAREGAATSD